MGWLRRRRTLRRAARRLSGSARADTRAGLQQEIAGYDRQISEYMSQLSAAIEADGERLSSLTPGTPDYESVERRLSLLRSTLDKVRSGQINDITEEEMNLEF